VSTIILKTGWLSMYDFVWSVCFWGSNPNWQDRYRNLISQILLVSRYHLVRENKCKVLFLLMLRGHNQALSLQVQEEAKKLPSNVDFKVLENDNWGMLVGSLWDAWKYLESNSVQFKYIFAMEDDWYFNHWNERAMYSIQKI